MKSLDHFSESQFSVCKIQNKITEKLIILKYILIHGPLGGSVDTRLKKNTFEKLSSLGACYNHSERILNAEFPTLSSLEVQFCLLIGLLGICYRNLKSNMF